ncbi:helix-turn-helix transcriptional regulator [Corynebacterium lizhenjunii]|uniref:Helix-turn-helix transcriptional regulator n=1 Tax=Corynebacterium lizhenjunii TaxID=2709394 RepID=A0A7T0PAD9_9CORY|nr:helix-turn-helix transcriptional regulator [Corynebacterium lizhenjunii]QPK79783.1 helix-turn-helix transcriptional regulator [Corynebacterium lizhenjunii]
MSVKHSLLALLARAPATASTIQQEFDTQLDGLWPLNIGQVSQTLARLQRDELIASAGTTTGPTGRTAELYALTPAGQAELEHWWSSSISRGPSERDELVLKLALAALRPELDYIDIVDTQRFATMEELRALNTANRSLPEDRNAQRLATERRIFELEATLRWLDRVEALSPIERTSHE